MWFILIPHGCLLDPELSSARSGVLGLANTMGKEL